MFCGNCGTKLPEGAKFCGSCGTSTEPAQHVNPEPQVNTAPNQSQQQAAPPPYQQGYASPPPPPQATTYYAPSNTEPLRVGQYILMFILLSIPIVGFILTLVWAFGGSVNLNKKNYARAVLILAVIGIVLSILFGAAILSAILGMLNSLSYSLY